MTDLDLADLPIDPELDGVLRLAVMLTGAGQAVINLLDGSWQYQLARTGSGWSRSPRHESLCQTAARSRVTVAVGDASAVPAFAGNPWVDGRRGHVRLYASTPLQVAGVIVGTLCVHDDTPGDLTGAHIAALEDLAALVVVLLQRRRTDRSADQAQSFFGEAYARLSRTQAFSRALLEALPVGVVAADADGQVTYFNRVSRQWHGHDEPAGEAARVAPADIPTAYDLFASDGVTPLSAGQVPLLRAFEEGRVLDAEIVIRAHGAQARLVTCSASRVMGDDGEVLGAVVAMADVTSQRKMEQQLRTAALHDGLTGLPNRTLLMDRLTHALHSATRQGTQVAVLYCDLDRFKAVNDHHGHAVGDEVLITAAGYLRQAVRPGDTVARLGGDEFVLLCPGMRSWQQADTIADRVRGAFTAPVLSTHGTHTIGISVGVAISGTDSSPDTLLSSADRAMYTAKRSRRDLPTPRRG
ncbi:diguanylate cyclase domain-containing protein [Klenkia sp. PcliD-1-E]|uniref:diguanylate cyclase domain-containing protein n=1 Tax=Klenkia sp. PcliD-1-E TaxID=2954492 RepID=UPI0020982929|nr:diguanylate cyclase [Klenkia sp. PcliD-1-E]MCO7218363.1 diguanylate cyclase [Klenkia sp. PcliD-1-E]